MASDNVKTLIFVAWVVAVCLVALATGLTTVPNWVVVAFVAIVPPLVVRNFWRVPEQTMTERINDARR